jgi:hypothetical protein
MSPAAATVGPEVELTNVELWLHFLKLSLEFGWIVD